MGAELFLLGLGTLIGFVFGWNVRQATMPRGVIACPICGKPVKGTRMVKISDTLYHQKCYQRTRGGLR